MCHSNIYTACQHDFEQSLYAAPVSILNNVVGTTHADVGQQTCLQDTAALAYANHICKAALCMHLLIAAGLQLNCMQLFCK